MSEYRNRARKPPDRKSSAETTPPTVVQPIGSQPPQFEPVSPDERDITPPLGEPPPIIVSCASHMMPGLMLTPPIQTAHPVGLVCSHYVIAIFIM